MHHNASVQVRPVGFFMHESDNALGKLISYLVDCVQYHALGLALLNELQRMILCHGWKCVKNVAFSWHCRHCSHTVKKSITMFIIHEYRLHGYAREKVLKKL